jgi:MoaA/NifB/PqqE/SkfB family radical SAM enzyme
MPNSSNAAKNIDLRQRWTERKRFEPSLRPPFPSKEMLVELVNACNHRCVFCAHQKMTRKRTEIDETLLKRVLKEAYDLGTREVGFYSTGEPFLSKKLPEYIRYAKELRFDYVYITTNGALATSDRMDAVIAAGVDSIKFSINGGSRETYKLVHGADDFDKVIQHLKYCRKLQLEKKEKTGDTFKLYVSFVKTRFTERETVKFQREYAQYCDMLMFYPVMDFGGLMSEVFDHIAPSDWQWENHICHLPYTAIGITAEGYLTACGCADFQNYLIVADLRDTSLYDAWYSETFTNLRKRFIDGDLKGLQCYNCVYGKQEPFEPLRPEYASRVAMDDLYTDRYIQQRLQGEIDVKN